MSGFKLKPVGKLPQTEMDAQCMHAAVFLVTSVETIVAAMLFCIVSS